MASRNTSLIHSTWWRSDRAQGHIIMWKRLIAKGAGNICIVKEVHVCGLWPTGSICCGCDEQIHMDYRSPVEKKGQHGHSLSEREGKRARESPSPAWTGFYCFSGYITSRMILIYYAQVCCRWLPFTDNKEKNVANYFKEKDVTDQGEKWLNWLHSILGRFSTDFRKLKILSQHLLPQSRVREF